MKKRVTQLILGMLLLAQFAYAQDRRIHGTVTSAGTPVPYANVVVKGTTLGVATDMTGNYDLTVPPSAKTLVISAIGYKTQEVNIENGTTFNVDMPEDVLKLNEVVVTAIGIVREKKALGYSVQDVNPSDVTHSGEKNLVEGLASKVAGVTVTGSAGVAGAGSYINIRGVKSISGETQPLFVVDGIIIDNSQLSEGNPDNGEGVTNNNNLLASVGLSNRMIDINPDDIENISVLKGAAATALYGIRAANGVIIITTKKGKPGTGGKGLNVSYSTSVSWDMVNKLPELQDKYSQGINGIYQGPDKKRSQSWGAPLDSLVYDNSTPYPWDKNGRIVPKSKFPGGAPVKAYDNLGNFFQTAMSWDNTVAVSGAGERTSYYFSAGHLGSKGIVPNNTFGRTTFRFNGDHKISKELSISTTTNYTNSGGQRIEQGSNTSGVMLGLLRTPVTFDNSNGYGKDAASHPDAYMFTETGLPRTYRGYGIYDNPYWTVNRNPLKDNVNRFIGSVQLNYKPFDWLTGTLRTGTDFYSDRRTQHFAIYSATAPSGRIFDDQYFFRNITEDLFFTGTHKFSSDFEGSLTLGQNLYGERLDRTFVQADQLVVPDFYDVSNATSVLARQRTNRYRTGALYADARASYKSTLFLDVTGRNEWSTSLPVKNNSFFYPSVSLGFVFTEPLKLNNNKIFPYGKLRASWANTGNDAPIYATATYYDQGFYGDGWTTVGDAFPWRGRTGYMMSNLLSNPDLRPENTRTFELGTDLRFFSNRIGVDFTYYNSRTTDAILNIEIPSSSGFESQVVNAGILSNKGIELVLTGTPIKTKTFNWDIAVNFARNRNMVEELAPGIKTLFLGGFEGTSVRAVAGKPFGEIYGHGWVRDKDGNLVVDDQGQNTDPKGKDYNPNLGHYILTDTEMALGSSFPLWTAGIRNTFSWKGFSLTGLIDIRHGGVMWNGTRSALTYFGRAKETEEGRDGAPSKVFDGVKGHLDDNGNVVSSGERNDIKAVMGQEWYVNGNGNGFITNNTEDFIEKTDWVRLRDLTLSYKLPQKVVAKTFFTNLEISATARNLFVSTKYSGVDPETSLMGASPAQGLDYFNMPNTKGYILGLRAGF